MGKTRNGKIAAGFTIVGFLLVLIAFTTPYWLVTDGKLDDPKIVRLGNYCLFDKIILSTRFSNKFQSHKNTVLAKIRFWSKFAN